MSRRISEFLGVALFALALIWLICARHLRADRPGVVLHDRGDAGRRRTSSAASARSSPELSFQLFGYAAYLLPAVIGGRRLALLLVPAARRRLHEAGRRHAALRLRQRVPQPRVRQHRRRRQDVPRRRLGRHLARRCARRLPESDRLDHRPADADDAVGDPVDAVLVRPHVRERDARARATCRRAASAGFRDLARAAARKTGSGARSSRSTRGRRPPGGRRQEDAGRRPRAGGRRAADEAERARPEATASRGAVPPVVARKRADVTPLPAARTRAGEGGAAPAGRVHAAAAVAARRAEGRAQDRRARADGRGAAARGEVPRVLGRGPGRADSSRARSSRPSSSSPTPA